MNYLGRGWASCVVGLRDYHRNVLRTLVAIREGADAWQLRGQLQHLLFDVEVDVAARAGAPGIARMTEVEREVFYPALLRLRSTVGAIPLSSPPATWAASLESALDVLRLAVRELRDWQPDELPRLVRARA